VEQYYTSVANIGSASQSDIVRVKSTDSLDSQDREKQRRVSTIKPIWAGLYTALWQVCLPVCFGLWQVCLPVYGRSAYRSMAGLSTGLWQVCLPVYGRSVCRSMAGLSAGLWQVCLAVYGRSVYRSMAGLSTCLWQVYLSVYWRAD